MITILNSKYIPAEDKMLHDMIGLSTDTKPTNRANGSSFIEMDTAKIYFFDADEEDWLEFAESEE